MQVLTEGGKFGIICAEPAAGLIIWENFRQLQQKRLDKPRARPPRILLRFFTILRKNCLTSDAFVMYNIFILRRQDESITNATSTTQPARNV